MVHQSMLCLRNGFMMATRVFLLISGTLDLLTLVILKNFVFHIIRHLMYQIVYATEEADAAHEFITNLPSDMNPKLVREAPNYPAYGNNLLLLLGRYCSNHLL
ncbi:hypothetical protein V1477_021121 [Vespula maculifrons]|uniref:Uncharacterized protein n=1 Tax=Vespula maculifrons TaxID=7453 RepID=A0ABD2AH74_VESMC